MHESLNNSFKYVGDLFSAVQNADLQFENILIPMS